MRRKVQHQPNGGSAWGRPIVPFLSLSDTHTRSLAYAGGRVARAGRTLFYTHITQVNVPDGARERGTAGPSLTGAVGFSLSLLTAWRTRAVGSPGLDTRIHQSTNKIVYRIARRCA